MKTWEFVDIWEGGDLKKIIPNPAFPKGEGGSFFKLFPSFDFPNLRWGGRPKNWDDFPSCTADEF